MKEVEFKASKDSMLGMTYAYNDAAQLITELTEGVSDKEDIICKFLATLSELLENKAKASFIRAVTEFSPNAVNDNITRH